MVRKIVRAMLWGVKGVLAGVALAALFLWPWSYWHPGVVAGRWVTVRTERADGRWLHAGCGQGQVAIGTTVWSFPPGSGMLAGLTSAGPAWTWESAGADEWASYVLETSPWGRFQGNR